ncbi:MAG TPA: barstar family protein [Pyrinomonadaceae bacterium]|nr:barstar family protein [Pyrinomonadaceae bacterium]
MAAFRDDPDDFQQLDYALLQNGSINLYYRPKLLAEDVEWLATHNYQIDNFDCTAWQTEEDMYSAFATTLDFPDYFGRNLAALNDCLRDIEVPKEGGRVLVFNCYDAFAAKMPEVAWHVLDILETNSRTYLLFGRRLLTLLQSNDPEIQFKSVGACPVSWNNREWLKKNRGL